MGNQPVYRYPPRSHRYDCPCPRCVQCRRTRRAGDGLIAYDMIAVAICALVVGVIWVVTAPLRIWHVIGADGQEHPDAATYAAYGVSGGLIVLLLVFFSVLDARKRRPPKGRLRVEATTPERLRPPPASVCVTPPPCLHPCAVRVASAGWPQETIENYCPDCDAQLGAGFRWSCCSAPPGNSPGAGHLYNCPNRKEQS